MLTQNYSDWYEFGTGIGGNVIATIAFCSYNNLMLLLIVIAINRYIAIAKPLKVTFT